MKPAPPVTSTRLRVQQVLIQMFFQESDLPIPVQRLHPRPCQHAHLARRAWPVARGGDGAGHRLGRGRRYQPTGVAFVDHLDLAPARVAITGSADAKASKTTIGMPSPDLEGRMKRAAAPY